MSSTNRCFELRTYVATPGNLDALVDRFRMHTAALFERHGMTNVGYWVVTDAEGASTDTLTYLLAHESREAAVASWQAFLADPEWISVRDASGEKLTASHTSSFMTPTEFSALR